MNRADIKVKRRHSYFSGKYISTWWIWSSPLSSNSSPWNPSSIWVGNPCAVVWTYSGWDRPLNDFTVSGKPLVLLRWAVRHLESIFSLILCQSVSLIENLKIKWPEICNQGWISSKEQRISKDKNLNKKLSLLNCSIAELFGGDRGHAERKPRHKRLCFVSVKEGCTRSCLPTQSLGS